MPVEVQEQFQITPGHHEGTVFDGERLRVKVGPSDVVWLETQDKAMSSRGCRSVRCWRKICGLSPADGWERKQENCGAQGAHTDNLCNSEH